MKILVTGGAGFIGSHLVDRLLGDGHEVVIVDNLSTGKEENLHPDAEFHQLDIQSPDLPRIFDEGEFETVCHLAAQIDVRKSVRDPLFDAESNILGTLNVLECCRKAGVKRVVFTSSGGVIYGDTEEPAKEGALPNPLSPYGVAKLACEGYLRCYAEWHSVDFVALRYANIYGPRQDPLGEAGVVAIFSNKLLRGESPTIYGLGKMVRDYVYVEDAVEAVVLAMAKGENKTLNIGTGTGTSVNQLFSNIKGLTGFQGKPTYEPKRPGELNKNVLNSERAKQILDWTPKVNLMEGLKRTVEWFKVKSSS